MSDSFYFVHQALTGNGSITARVTSLTSAVPVPHGGTRRAVVPWAKAGIILKASLTPGSAYAAIMVTGSHGVRMQDDFTGDIAGPAASGLAAAGPGRLPRSPVTRRADGARWTRVGAVTLQGLPATVQGGLFATSPQYTQTSLGVASINGSPSQSTADFDHVALTLARRRMDRDKRGRLVRRPPPGPPPATRARPAAGSRSRGPVTSRPPPTGRPELA